MVNPFPWKIWLKLNVVCLPGLLWFLIGFSSRAALILAIFTVIPVNVLIAVQWVWGRIHGDSLGNWAALQSCV